MLGLNAVFPESRNASVPSLASRLPSPILQPAPAALTGAGNPDFITMQAINAMNPVDVFFIPDKALRKLISAAPAVSEVLRPSLKALKIELLVISALYKGVPQFDSAPGAILQRSGSIPKRSGDYGALARLRRSARGPGAH
jgi:hypothetical protein